jgi:threonine dehydrogenase-like Zn-dependent dehydrogenase
MRSLWGRAPFLPVATDLLARRVIDPDLLVTQTFGLDDCVGAFKVLTDPEAPAVKVVMVP